MARSTTVLLLASVCLIVSGRPVSADAPESVSTAFCSVKSFLTDFRQELCGVAFGAPPEKVSDEPIDSVVQIVANRSVPIRQELSPDSPILGIANKGSYYELVGAGDSWIKILFNGKEGWVERRNIAIVAAPSRLVLREFIILLGVVLSAGIVLLILWKIATRRGQVPGGWIKSESVEKNLLILAHSEKSLQRYLTNTPVSLSRCFQEIGFQVMTIRDGNKLMDSVSRRLPDVMVVDWKFAPNVHNLIERALSSRSTTANVLVIFYNVADPASVQQSRIILNAQYLGLQFSDRELFSLVTPLIMTGSRSKEIRKSVEVSALEGDVGNGSLLEVFQFVEIGHKTGCLLIETTKPVALIYFRDGIIIYAASSKETGKKAVFEALSFDEGRFRFVLDRTPKNDNCSLPTLGILMEWTKELDEASGH